MLFQFHTGGSQAADTFGLFQQGNRSTAGASLTLWKVQMGPHKHMHTHTRTRGVTAGRPREWGFWVFHLVSASEPKNIFSCSSMVNLSVKLVI